MRPTGGGRHPLGVDPNPGRPISAFGTRPRLPSWSGRCRARAGSSIRGGVRGSGATPLVRAPVSLRIVGAAGVLSSRPGDEGWLLSSRLARVASLEPSLTAAMQRTQRAATTGGPIDACLRKGAALRGSWPQVGGRKVGARDKAGAAGGHLGKWGLRAKKDGLGAAEISPERGPSRRRLGPWRCWGSVSRQQAGGPPLGPGLVRRGALSDASDGSRSPRRVGLGAARSGGGGRRCGARPVLPWWIHPCFLGAALGWRGHRGGARRG